MRSVLQVRGYGRCVGEELQLHILNAAVMGSIVDSLFG